MLQFTKEENIVTLYFTAMGVKSSAVPELLSLKCDTQRSLNIIHDEIRDFKANSDIYDAATSTWKLKDVGRYLRTYGLVLEFDTLISFGYNEYDVVRAVSLDCYSSPVHWLTNILQKQDLNDVRLKFDELTVDHLGVGHNEITDGFYEAPYEGPQPWLDPPF